MKEHIKIRPLYCVFAALTVFAVGCASMQVSGKDPVDRAISAAALLIDSKTSDSYIKVYKNEMGKAELLIADMLKRAEVDQLVYADVADSVSDWLVLYSRVALLQKRYPNGLAGKREYVRFEPVDYTQLQKDAEERAADALYTKAFGIYKAARSPALALDALPFLTRAKKYGSQPNEKVNALGAMLCYDAAESFAQSENPDMLLKASEYYAQANSWQSGYKGSVEKNVFVRQKAAALYMEEGDTKVRLANYTAFRQAKKAYAQAEKIVPGSVTKELADVSAKLTLKLVIVYGGMNSSYPGEIRVREALQTAIASSTMGPDNVDVRFIRDSGILTLLLSDFDDADIVLLPANDFGKIKEEYGPVRTLKISVSKTVDGVTYTGTIVEQSQEVTVYFRNNSILYDIRKGRRNIIEVFQEEAHKTSKTFTARIYQGDERAKPAWFHVGALYVPGRYDLFFPNFRQKNDDYVPVTENLGTLNETGKKLCRLISNIQYQP